MGSQTLGESFGFPGAFLFWGGVIFCFVMGGFVGFLVGSFLYGVSGFLYFSGGLVVLGGFLLFGWGDLDFLLKTFGQRPPPFDRARSQKSFTGIF